MPLYTYKCNNCDMQFEVVLKMKERDTYVSTLCGNCYDGSLVRVPDSGTFKINGYSEANGYSNGH